MAKLTLSRKGQLYNTFFLTGTEWLVGSNPDCPVRLDAHGILPHHARISRHGGEYRVTALSNATGIRVNHGHAREHVLRDGDIIYLGGYTLTFSADAHGTAGHMPVAPARAWLQVLNGTHQGRIFQLQHPVTRFGSAGDLTVMISRRRDGYYLSHLEGDELPQVNQTVINDTPWQLNQGDTIRMGGLRFGFFAEYEQSEQPAGVPGDSQRHCTRVSLHNPATIVANGDQWDTRLMDLSLSGALLEHPGDWMGKTGECYLLRLLLADQLCLEVDVQVRQITPDRIGMAFVELDEADRDEICGLVERKLGNTDLLQRELSELAREYIKHL